MSTAVASFGKNHKNLQTKSESSLKAIHFVKTETKKTRALRFARKVFIYSLILSVVLTIAAAAVFYFNYNYYSTVVDQRIASGFWHSRAGIYSAPYTLKKDQKTSPNNVVEMLRRSGYVEGETSEEIWNGNFTVNGNTISVNTKNYANGQTDNALIEFKDNKIASITNAGKSLESFNIEPELLTGRSETKRGKNHVLTYQDIPENLRNAILMAEDRRFFEHHGIDPQGIIRAMFANYQNGSIKQGGSTITQQLVKNTFLSPVRSFNRKFSEAFLSLALERRMTKEEIFTLYCNEIYLGQYGLTGIHGVEQAARAYFDKDLKDLDLQESAAIAAMIKNPNRFAPHKNAEEAVSRRNWIMSKMAEANPALAPEAEIALKSELKLAKPKNNDQTIAPYFVDSATKEINEKFKADYLNTNFNNRIYTTIDTQLQNLAEQSVANQLAALDKVYAKKGLKLQATLIAIDPQNGHILAMVGGRDYKESQFNRATEAMRQPGSTFKPFVYATALEKGMTPVSVYSDEPTEFQFYNQKNYKPANYGDSYAMKNITLKTALAKSSNIVAVKTSLDAGLKSIANKAKDFGFENVQEFPSMALGTNEVTPLQLAAAYCVFANGGRKIVPTFVDKIVSIDDESVYTSSPPDKQIINPRTAYMITDMLEAVVERGTAKKAFGALGKDIVFAGKTGSSKDGWFVGYTPNLVTVAWIGLDDNQDIGATGGEVALPLWVDFMKSVVQTRPEFGGESFTMPKGLSEVTVDPETGMIADVYCPQTEKVVMPTNAVSSVKCLKHQPMPETYVAQNEAPQSEIYINKTEITPAVYQEQNINAEEKKEFKEVNGVPSEQSQPSGEKPAKPVVKRTYVDDFENQKVSNEDSK